MNQQDKKNKVLVVYSNDGQNPANFVANFHQPIKFPVNSQVRLVNCRINLDDNDIIINEDNNSFQWGLGFAWSDPVNGGSSGFPLFTARIKARETGYIAAAGSTSDFITKAIEDALNESCSSMPYLRGGFSCSISGGKLEVKLSKCVVPTTTNAAATRNNWLEMNITDDIENPPVSYINSPPDFVVDSANGLSGLVGANGCRFRLRHGSATKDRSAYISSPIVSGLSGTDGLNSAFIAQLDLTKMAVAGGNTGNFTEFGVTPRDLTNRGYNGNLKDLFEEDGWEYPHNIVYDLGGNDVVNGMIGFRYLRDNHHLEVYERNVDIDAYIEGRSELTLSQTRLYDVDLDLTKILQIQIKFLEPTGHPVLLGASPKYKYRIEIEYTDGSGLLGGDINDLKDIPEYFYSLRNNPSNPHIEPSEVLRENPSPLSAYVVTRGIVGNDPDSLFISCAFDDMTANTKRNIDVSNQPLVIFGENLTLQAKNTIEEVYAPFNHRIPYNYTTSNLGLQLGYNNDELSLGGNGTSFTTGLQTPEALAPSRADEACYYLQMPDLPVSNFTGSRDKGQPNSVVGLISLKQRSSDLYFPSETKTPLYIDLLNTSPLQYNALQFRITNKQGEDVKDILNYTIMTLEIRQNPQHQLAELFRGLGQQIQQNNEQVRRSVMQQPKINSMGQ